MKKRFENEITRNFPYPIAVSFARLRTDECLDPGPLRLKHMLATAEAAIRFCGILVLCECRAALEAGELEQPPDALAHDFAERLRAPAWGSWMHIAREGLKWLRSAEHAPFCCGLSEFLLDARGKATPAAKALSSLLELRNRLDHHKLRALHPAEFRELCEQNAPHLDLVLEALSFLLDYGLTFVSEIQVHKPRNREASFRHRFKICGGESDTFKGERESLPSFWESQSIIFRDEEADRYLNLDPFLLYDEETARAPDLFYFDGLKRPGCASYSACKHGGEFLSEKSERARDISEEIENLLSLLSPSRDKADE